MCSFLLQQTSQQLLKLIGAGLRAGREGEREEGRVWGESYTVTRTIALAYREDYDLPCSSAAAMQGDKSSYIVQAQNAPAGTRWALLARVRRKTNRAV